MLLDTALAPFSADMKAKLYRYTYITLLLVLSRGYIWYNQPITSKGRRGMVRLRVREIAEQKGISRGKLSRLSDLSYPTVRDIWNDPYRDVSVSTLEKLAKALGVSTAELIEDVPEDNDKEKPW